MPDPRAEMLAAAEAARTVCLSRPPPSLPRRARRASPVQAVLWDAPASPRAPVSKASPDETLSPLQAALRLPVRPSPELPRSGRNPHAIREGIPVSNTECVVRVALDAETSLYFVALAGPPFSGGGPIPVGVTRSADPTAPATICRACPETAGASSWRGCVIVNLGGPSSTEAARIDTWIAHEAERQQAALRAVAGRPT